MEAVKGIPVPVGGKWRERIKGMLKNESIPFDNPEWSSVKNAVLKVRGRYPARRFKTRPDPEEIGDRRIWRIK